LHLEEKKIDLSYSSKYVNKHEDNFHSPRNATGQRLKGIVSRDEYFFKACNKKIGLSVHALWFFEVFFCSWLIKIKFKLLATSLEIAHCF
jgi:hypothetical protein